MPKLLAVLQERVGDALMSDAAISANDNVFPDSPSGIRVAFDRGQLKGTNIHPDTLLATDYLNHFNEVAMMIEMIPMMPEAIDDIAGWVPSSYQDHFQGSGLRDADLAVAAYHHAPEMVRITFEDTIERLNVCVSESIAEADKLGVINNAEILAFKASEIAGRIFALIEEAGTIINGGSFQASKEDATQDAIDSLFD
jgi:hypothetical protein